MTAWPLNCLVSAWATPRTAAGAYLVAAATDSRDVPVPETVRRAADGRWARRILRFAGADAYRHADFATAKSLALAAADGEVFSPLRAEYVLAAGAAAHEAGEYEESLALLGRANRIWKTSFVARMFEPKVGWVANSLMWSCLHAMGRDVEALPFLRAAAEVPGWSTFDRCGPWLQYLRQAYHDNDAEATEYAWEQVRKHSLGLSAEVRDWRSRLH